MIERKLLKCLLNKEFYLQAKNKIVKDMFPGPLRAVYETLEVAHNKYDYSDINVTDLAALHYSRHPALTVAAHDNLEHVFDLLVKEEDIHKGIAFDILEAACIREKARQIGVAAIEVVNGKKTDFSELRGLLDSGLLDGTRAGVSAVEAPTELEDLIEGVKSNVKWLFNIESLRQIVPGIGPGIFTIIAMRPEAGKTTLHSFLTAGPEGLAWQGAKVDLIGNEEPVTRTKMRHVCAATGWTEQEIFADINGAKQVWERIKRNIRGFDAVGMTLEQLDDHVAATTPDVLIVDQLDKIHVSEKFNSSHEALRYIYTGFREIVKRHNLAGIGISQLSAEAQGKSKTDFSMMENSKTGKAAEADVIICGGKRDEEGYEYLRYLNVTKNKISGRHETAVVKIYPETSRYTV